MDLHDGILDIPVRPSIIKEVADDSLLQIEEIIVGSLEMSNFQWPS